MSGGREFLPMNDSCFPRYSEGADENITCGIYRVGNADKLEFIGLFAHNIEIASASAAGTYAYNF